jgi:hypothetical protein
MYLFIFGKKTLVHIILQLELDSSELNKSMMCLLHISDCDELD